MDYTKLVGPVLGAVIGYGTNWIAIKMLFRPLKPIKIGKFTLPFTPGIIPKRKSELATAIGNVVGNNLITTEDIQKLLISENIENAVSEKVLLSFKSEKNIKEILKNFIDNDEYIVINEKLKKVLCEKIKEGLIEAKLGDTIALEGKKVVSNKVKNSMLKMFITDDLINSIVEPIGNEVENYIRENGDKEILPVVEKDISEIENMQIFEIIQKIGLDDERVGEFVKKIYRNFITNYSSKLLEELKISQIVEEKINQMETLELERLILSVMKKELKAIVNLGALIGLLLGSLNVLV